MTLCLQVVLITVINIFRILHTHTSYLHITTITHILYKNFNVLYSTTSLTTVPGACVQYYAGYATLPYNAACQVLCIMLGMQHCLTMLYVRYLCIMLGMQQYLTMLYVRYCVLCWVCNNTSQCCMPGTCLLFFFICLFH
jgi:hypothetical protein